MPIGAITMILTNVGLQIFNSWRSSRQNGLLQQKREDFEKAARERNTQRMWQLMREGQEITRQLEDEKHRQRLEELKNDIVNLMQKLTYSSTINNWPLNVLPLVMKNQSLGNLIANQEDTIALHCILTPSNSQEYNQNLFPQIESELEEYCNNYWRVNSDHPVLFYSRAWKYQQNPTEIQIDSMRAALGNLPVLVISPFFRPQDGILVFHVRFWGLDNLSNGEFCIPELVPTDFQRQYKADDNFIDDSELIIEHIEDIVPFIQCLIGYFADAYFWSTQGAIPLLPSYITKGIINTDGMKYLVNDSHEYYDKLLLQNIKNEPFLADKLYNLCYEAPRIWNSKDLQQKVVEIFCLIVRLRSNEDISDFNSALNPIYFNKEDIPLIRVCRKYFHGTAYEEVLYRIERILDSINFDYEILSLNDKVFLENESKKQNAIALYRLGEIYEFSIGVDQDIKLAEYYYKKSEDLGFILAKIRNSSDRIGNYRTELTILENSNVDQAYGLECEELYSTSSFEHIVKLYGSIDINHPLFCHIVALSKINLRVDICQAENTLQKLAESGYIESIIELSKQYRGGILGENPKLHFHYSQKGMLQNNPFCMYCLGMCYLDGYGTIMSAKNALYLLENAAKMGNEDAIKIFNVIKEFQI